MAASPKANSPEERADQVRLWIEHRLYPERFDGQRLYDIVRERWDLSHTTYGQRIPKWLRAATESELAAYLENGIPDERPWQRPSDFTPQQVELIAENAVLATRVTQLEQMIRTVLKQDLVQEPGISMLQAVLKQKR